MPFRFKEGKKPAEDVFQHHSIKDPEVKHFEETVRIQGPLPRDYKINFPKSVEREMGFVKDRQVKVSLEGERIIVELMEKPRYISRVWKSGESLLTAIESEMLKKMGSEQKSGIKWNLPDAVTMRMEGRSLVMCISSEIAKEKNIKAGDHVEFVIDGRDITIKPLPAEEEVCLSKLTEVISGQYPFAWHLAMHIPKEILNKLDKRKWRKGAEVGFEVLYNEHKQLIITTKQFF